MNEASARTINPKTMRGPFCEWAEVPTPLMMTENWH